MSLVLSNDAPCTPAQQAYADADLVRVWSGLPGGGEGVRPTTSGSRTIIPAPVYADASLYGILLGNLVTLSAAVMQHWSFAPLLWVYWGQSVVIGVANVIRMLRLREFSTEGFTFGDNPVPETRAGLWQTAGFFAFHFGFFDFVYFKFLASGRIGGTLDARDVPGVAISIASFIIAHAYSLIVNEKRDFRDSKPNLGRIMFYPYLRILPMHLTIMFGVWQGSLALPIFIGLKTAADVGMHVVEHALFRRAHDAGKPTEG